MDNWTIEDDDGEFIPKVSNTIEAIDSLIDCCKQILREDLNDQKIRDSNRITSSMAYSSNMLRTLRYLKLRLQNEAK